MNRTTKTLFMGNLTREKYILCKYSEGENGEVKLTKVAELWTKEEADKEACELLKNEARAVILTELVFSGGWA